MFVPATFINHFHMVLSQAGKHLAVLMAEMDPLPYFALTSHHEGEHLWVVRIASCASKKKRATYLEKYVFCCSVSLMCLNYHFSEELHGRTYLGSLYTSAYMSNDMQCEVQKDVLNPDTDDIHKINAVCRHKKTWRVPGSFMMHLPNTVSPVNLCRFIYWFSQMIPLEQIINYTGLSRKTASKCADHLRSLLNTAMEKENEKLGGADNLVVCIDETYLTKKKQKPRRVCRSFNFWASDHDYCRY